MRVAYNKPVSVVMITYNEAGHIEMVLNEYYNDIFRLLSAGSEFILYLDKPTDATPGIVRRFSKNKDIRVLEGVENLGYRGAMQRALGAARNDIIFYSDSSGKHRAADFWDLLPHADCYDIVTGLRHAENYSLVRKIVTACQRVLISVLFLMPLYDFNTGFKIVHKKVLDDVLDACCHTKQSFSSELTIRAYAKGYTVKNVPVVFRGRTEKNTGTNITMLPGIMWHSFRGLFALRWELFRRRMTGII